MLHRLYTPLHLADRYTPLQAKKFIIPDQVLTPFHHQLHLRHKMIALARTLIEKCRKNMNHIVELVQQDYLQQRIQVMTGRLNPDGLTLLSTLNSRDSMILIVPRTVKTMLDCLRVLSKVVINPIRPQSRTNINYNCVAYRDGKSGNNIKNSQQGTLRGSVCCFTST